MVSKQIAMRPPFHPARCPPSKPNEIKSIATTLVPEHSIQLKSTVDETLEQVRENCAIFMKCSVKFPLKHPILCSNKI